MKINKKSLALALVAVAGIAAIATTKVRAAADTQLLALMPPDSQILAGARVDQSLVSPVGQYIQAKMGASPTELKDKTGFDIRTDLREVIISPIPKLGAARGSFPVAQLETFMQEHGSSVEDYRGFRILGNANDGTVFLDASTALIGRPDAVHAAIDRWIARAQAPDNDMTAKVAEVSSTSQTWFAATNLSALQSQMGPNTPDVVKNILQKIAAASGQVTLPPAGGALMEGQVQAASPEDAQTLADAFQALKLLAPAEAAANPLLNPKVSVNASTIAFSNSLTEQQVETILH